MEKRFLFLIEKILNYGFYFKDFRGLKTRPEYIGIPGKNQLEHHFDIGQNNDVNMKTHYGSEFYQKNQDKVKLNI